MDNLEPFTGLEQYYWEKAGYFVRHIAADKMPSTEYQLQDFVRLLVYGILGPRAVSILDEMLPFNRWNRSKLPIDVDAFELTRRDAALRVIAPKALVSVALIPGSHVAPLDSETISKIGEGLHVDTAVNISLNRGDLLFCNPYMANYVMINMGMIDRPLLYIGPGHPDYPGSEE